ncbi:MAG TPA: DUF4214 domain-containing protein, partial [Lapillicoccus sp.]|nr:DUF4214 domain-containing protein [Lapillicoccus sp.]
MPRLLEVPASLWRRVRRQAHVLRRTDPDEVVRSAYLEALGREPDPEGAATYRAVVREGLSKEGLVLTLTRSPEGVRRAVHQGGLTLDDGSDSDFLEKLYLAALGRPADASGRAWLQGLMDAGATRMEVTLTLAHSEEALNRQWAKRITIQDLHALRPDSFETVPTVDGGQTEVFRVAEPADIDWMERAILDYGYYEKPGIWSLAPDDDKRRMAELLAPLADERALEIGCSSGTVLEGLASRGVLVDGVDVSRMAVQRANPAIRPRIRIGDLLEVDLDSGYDLLYGLDLFEHLNPNRFDRYLQRVRALIRDDGFVFVNSPAFGNDPVYGEVFPLSLPSWSAQASKGELFDRWLV